MAKTLKLSTASVNKALTEANVVLAKTNEYTGRVEQAGAAVKTVNSAYAHGKIQKASFVEWYVKTPRFRPLTDEERAGFRKEMDEGLDRACLALILAGYAVTTKVETLGKRLVVTLP